MDKLYPADLQMCVCIATPAVIFHRGNNKKKRKEKGTRRALPEHLIRLYLYNTDKFVSIYCRPKYAQIFNAQATYTFN